MPLRRDVEWYEVDRRINGLETDVEYQITFKREVIPLIFVPGIMGSRLRRAGTKGTGDGPDGLPNVRWDPGSELWTMKHFAGASGHDRKKMLVGASFSSDYLEVEDCHSPGDGWSGILDDYHAFLTELRGHDWGPLQKIFEFPVYAAGYNWSDDALKSGGLLAQRIKSIIEEARGLTGLCERVILITHSMGGLVARAASELKGARDSILGIIHGVQPATGASAAYWRIKAGFEGFGPTSWVLGNSGPTVAPVLGNIPGGLELLPNKHHRTNAGGRAWLTITGSGQPKRLPVSDPYAEIYRVPAVVKPTPGQTPSTNTYWGLVDPALLDPGAPAPPPMFTGSPGVFGVFSSAPLFGASSSTDNDTLAAARPTTKPWPQYLRMLQYAESFHDALKDALHPRTFCFYGINSATADVVEFRVESNWLQTNPYPTRGFRGLFVDVNGDDMQAVLQDPVLEALRHIPPSHDVGGQGDGTVPIFSAGHLVARSKNGTIPRNPAIRVEHQPAFEDDKAQAFTIQAIVALAKMRYDDRRARLGDFPPPGRSSNLA